MTSGGVSALFVSRELSVRYETAWLMCHKLRHGLTESGTEFLLDGIVELGEAFYGGGKQQGDRGRAQTEGKATMVCAVEKLSTAGTGNQGINQPGCIAGGARIAVLASAAAESLGGFIRSNIKPGTLIVSDRFKGYAGVNECKQLPAVPGAGANAGVARPIVHTLFGNIGAWLNGTFHGVSVKHLPRYLREWNYRFNRRGRIGELDGFLLRRAVGRGTITYAELVAGANAAGA
jgi:transposase-like protein